MVLFVGGGGVGLCSVHCTCGQQIIPAISGCSLNVPLCACVLSLSLYPQLSSTPDDRWSLRGGVHRGSARLCCPCGLWRSGPIVMDGAPAYLLVWTLLNRLDWIFWLLVFIIEFGTLFKYYNVFVIVPQASNLLILCCISSLFLFPI
jgi:hypothetical protein